MPPKKYLEVMLNIELEKRNFLHLRANRKKRESKKEILNERKYKKTNLSIQIFS